VKFSLLDIHIAEPFSFLTSLHNCYKNPHVDLDTEACRRVCMQCTTVMLGSIEPTASSQCSNYGGPGPLSSGSAPDPHYRLALRARHKAPLKTF